nr:unnamed protein product [Callosobruchus chinensis]
MNKTKITPPSGDEKYISFSDFKNKQKVPFVIYADLETILEDYKDSNNTVKKENYSQFSLMLDELSVHITALDDLKLTKETLYDSIIIHVASEKLDKSTRREWKDFRQGKELSTLSEFLSFLKDRLDVLQSLEDDQCQTTLLQLTTLCFKFHLRTQRNKT